MRTFVVGATLLTLFIAPRAQGADERSNAEPVAGLIRALSSSKYTERDKAARELRRIGEPALKQLKDAALSTDIEVRERALATIQVIEQKIENDKLLLAPKLHLKYDKTPLQEAVADLARKTGLKYQLDPKSAKDPKQPINLDTGEVPYWEAIERFLVATGLTEVAPPAPANNQGQLYYDLQPRQFRGGLRRGGGGSQPPQPQVETAIKLIDAKTTLSAATATLIRVKALPTDAVGSGVVKGSNHLMLQLEVTPAPALTWQGVVNVDVRKVVDERGVALVQSHTHNPLGGAENTIWMDGGIQIIQQGQAQIIIQGGGGNVQIWNTGDVPNQPSATNPRHVPVALLARDSTTKVLKELEGVITAEVLTPPQPVVTLDNLLKVKSKDMAQKGDYQLEVVDRTETGDQIRLRVRVRMPVRNDFLAFNGRAVRFAPANDWSYQPGQNQVQLQDASGKPISNVSMQLMEQSFDGITQTSLYSFTISRKANPEPAQFVVVGRRVATVEIPFALKNVPLP
jgi:hypothetical protein